MDSSPHRTLADMAPWITRVVIIVVLAVFAARNLASWPTAWRYPGEIYDLEGRPVAEMVELRSGIPIYAPASPEWWASANYGPLYYLLGSHLLPAQHPAYRNLRMLSMAAALGSALFCGLLAWQISKSRFAAAVAALLFLGFSLVDALAVACRCDMVAMFLAAAGFWVAHRYQLDRRLLWSSPIFVLALFYKLQFVAAPAAVVTFLLMRKRHRSAAEFAGACVAGALIVLCLLQRLAFPGQALLLHMIGYNLLPFSARRAVFFLGIFGIMLLPVVLGAIESLRQNRDAPLACYLGWACAVAFATIGKEGSTVTYFAEVAFVLCPLVAALLTFRVQKRDLPGASQVLILIAISLLVSARLVMHPVADAPDFANDAAIQSYLQRRFPRGTRALSDYGGDLARAGLSTPIADLYAYSWLCGKGRIRIPDLVAQIQKQRFGVILVRTDVTSAQATRTSEDMYWTEDLRRGILENYRVDECFRAGLPDRQRRYFAWVPR